MSARKNLIAPNSQIKALVLVGSAKQVLVAAADDIKRGDRIDALDTITMARKNLASASRVIRASLRKDGLR